MHESPDKSALAYRNQQFLDSADARSLRILSEYLYPLSHFRQQKIQDTVVFFGSARTLEMGPLGRYYNEARELAKRITEWSNSMGENGRRFVVCSGGGPGIMEAANRGARDAGGKTIGLNIGLPFEQRPNPFITPELSFEFHYFFMRKFWFAYLAKALVVFPGGSYRIVAIDLEGTEVCDWLNSIAVNCVLLKYRVPQTGPFPKSDAALQDAQRAVGIVREHAAEWRIDPKRIGVLGFSAGGHLAAALSTHHLTSTMSVGVVHPFCVSSDNSARVGSRPEGVRLLTTPGRTCESCLVSSSSGTPVRPASILMMSGPRAEPSWPGETG